MMPESDFWKRSQSRKSNRYRYDHDLKCLVSQTPGFVPRPDSTKNYIWMLLCSIRVRDVLGNTTICFFTKSYKPFMYRVLAKVIVATLACAYTGTTSSSKARNSCKMGSGLRSISSIVPKKI